MKAFLKENSIMIIGLSLPIFIAIIFSLAQLVGKTITDPPQYSVIYSTGTHNSNNGYHAYIKDNKVYYAFNAPKNGRNYYNQDKIRVYVYTPKDNNNLEIETPNFDDLTSNHDVPLSDIKASKISALLESPDGYIFEKYRYNNSNLIGDIFGAGRHSKSTLSLIKNGNRVEFPLPHSTNYYQTRFLGWIVEE